jgi:hypothetical protein
MTLILGTVTLNRVKEFTITDEAKFPRGKILGADTNSIKTDVYDKPPHSVELTCVVSNADRLTLEGYKGQTKTLADSAIGFSESLIVEEVVADAVMAVEATVDYCWNVSIYLVKTA